MSELTKEEKHQFILDFSRKYIMSFSKQLINKKMSIDEVIKALKYQLVEKVGSQNAYKFTLERMQELYGKLVYEDDNEKLEIRKKLGLNYDEVYHKLSAELMTLIEDDKWIGIFYSKEHFEAFEYILDSFYIEEHTKTLFSSLWLELGGDKAQKILMRCTCKKYTDWVFKHYLPNEEKKPISFVSVKVKDEHHYRKQIRIKKKTYKDQDIFKSTVLRRLQK